MVRRCVLLHSNLDPASAAASRRICSRSQSSGRSGGQFSCFMAWKAASCSALLIDVPVPELTWGISAIVHDATYMGEFTFPPSVMVAYLGFSYSRKAQRSCRFPFQFPTDGGAVLLEAVLLRFVLSCCSISSTRFSSTLRRDCISSNFVSRLWMCFA